MSAAHNPRTSSTLRSYRVDSIDKTPRILNKVGQHPLHTSGTLLPSLMLGPASRVHSSRSRSRRAKTPGKIPF